MSPKNRTEGGDLRPERTTRYGACILLVGLVLPCLAMDPADRRTFADGLYARGLYGLAAKEYAALADVQHDLPQRDVIRYRLGVCLLETGDYVVADRRFQQVFREEPPSDWRYRAGYKRGELFMRLKRWPDAIELFRALLDAKPGDDIRAAALYGLGECYLACERLEDAVRTFGELRTDLGDTEMGVYATLKLGMIAAEGLTAASADDASIAPALLAFKEVLAKAPTPRMAAEALFQSGELYYRAGQYEASAAAFRQMLAEHPQDERAAAARLRAAWAAHNAGLYEESIRNVDVILNNDALGDDDRLAWSYLRANCQRQLLDHEAALTSYTNLLARFPGSRYENDILLEAAVCEQRRGRHREALALALKAKPEGDRRCERYWICAEANVALKNPDGAVQFYRLITREFPDHAIAADAAYRLAHALQVRGEYLAAANQYRSVVAKPRATVDMRVQARLAAGHCLAKADQREDAIREWAQLIQKHPDHPLVADALYQKAVAEIRLKREDEALQTLAALLKRAGHNYTADALYWKGVIAARREKPLEAGKHYRAALNASPREALRTDIVLALGVLRYNDQAYADAESLLLPLVMSDAVTRMPPAILFWLADRRLDAGKGDAAEIAGKVLAKDPDKAWQEAGWLLAARAHTLAARKDEAEQALGTALSIGAGSRYAAEGALLLGDLLLARKAYEASEQAYAQAASLATDPSVLSVRARGYRGMARAWEARERPAEAARYYMLVAVLYDDPEMVPACLRSAAVAYRAAGDEASARKALDELAARYPDTTPGQGGV